jgi:hypothetical protein
MKERERFVEVFIDCQTKGEVGRSHGGNVLLLLFPLNSLIILANGKLCFPYLK